MPSVSIMSATETDDDLGNSTTNYVESVYPYAWPSSGGVIFAPRSSQERTDARVPAVISDAQVYGPAGAAPGSRDLIVLSGHSDAMDGEWQVDGQAGEYVHPNGWSAGYEVAVKRASS